MRNLFLGTSAILLFISMFAFLFLTIDIVDGRNSGSETSPFIGASTSTAALAISIITMLLSLFMAVLFLTLMKANDDVINDMPKSTEKSAMTVTKYGDETWLVDWDNDQAITHI